MRDSWNTLLGALGALLVLLLLLYTPDTGLQVSRPTSSDHGANGYRGLANWLEDAGIKWQSHRLPYSDMVNTGQYAARGNVLITTMPHRKSIKDAEHTELRSWIGAGNTLLVLATLNDTPAWVIYTASGGFFADIEKLTTISFEAAVDEEGEEIIVGELLGETKLTLEPLPAHPLMKGVNELSFVTDSISNIWVPDYPKSEEGAFYLGLAYEPEQNYPALFEIPVGAGRIILSASASLLSNRMLEESDNAQFFANLIGWHLSDDGQVIVDDFHQGISDLYDAEDFFADPRLHYTMWFILAFWLIYLVGTSTRLAPVREFQTASHQANLVTATGGLMSRKLSRKEAGRAMVLTWVKDLQRAGRIPPMRDDDVPWEHIAALPNADTSALDAIRESYARLGRGKKVRLSYLHNRISDMKRSQL